MSHSSSEDESPSDESKRKQIEFEKNVDVSPAILWITDKDGSCNYLSKQWYDMTGQTPEQALGFGWLEATHPEDKLRTAEIYMTANAQQKPFYAEYRLKTKSGEYHWAIDAGNPRFDKEGNYLGYAGTVFDINEQKLAAEAMRSLDYRFRRSAQATNLGVWYCDLPFDVLNWNDEVKRHFFLPITAEVNIDLFYERIHPDDREPTRLAIQQSIESKTPYDTIYRTTNPCDPQETKSIRAFGWTDYDTKGHPTRFDGITLDVTLELQRRTQLEAAKAEAERANQLKSSFLANMSHEIRTPLSAILGFTDLLKDNDLGHEDRAQFLEIISRNGLALTKIIDDILDLAKVESGKLEIEHTEFSFHDLMTEVIDLFRERLRAKGIFLKSSLHKEIPNRIISDPTRLRQILINIIGNAVKFTNEGGVTIEAKFATRDSNRVQIEVLVLDTGIGMSEEQGNRIFQPFMQADNTMTRKFGGTGLGLSLSKRLAIALNGDVEIRSSSLNEGSTFAISFGATLPVGGRQKGGVDGPITELSQSLRGIHVLVADDSPDNVYLVSRILSQHGAQVDSASNGLEALQKGSMGAYDILLMDIQMPGMDGYEATRALRAAGFKKPIVALTAHAMAEERTRSLAEGCNGHLTKPINRADLLETIRALAEK